MRPQKVASYLRFKNTTRYRIKLLRDAAGAETSWAIVALHIWASLLSDIPLQYSICPPQKKTAEPARFPNWVCVPRHQPRASKVQMDLHVLKEKMLQRRTRHSCTWSGPKNAGIMSTVVRAPETILLKRTRRSKTLSRLKSAGLESEVVRTEEKMLQSRTRRSKTLSGQEPAGLESEVVRTKENVLQNRTRRSKTLSGQEPAGLESEVVRTGAFSENVFFCLQARCAAIYGPKVKQPTILLDQSALQRN